MRHEIKLQLNTEHPMYNRAKHETINAVLSLIDGSQTYKVTSDEEDTYIDKQVLRETVEALRKEGEK